MMTVCTSFSSDDGSNSKHKKETTDMMVIIEKETVKGVKKV